MTGEMTIRSFEPSIDRATRILIVGSMPGGGSLRRGEYYAHPRNRFWPMIETVCRIPAALPYIVRMRMLLDAGIGLWDVLSSCERSGSLDTRIERGSERFNDFTGIVYAGTTVEKICCNGIKAYEVFMNGVAPMLDEAVLRSVEVVRLPSTSPANAGYLFDDIVRAWSCVLI